MTAERTIRLGSRSYPVVGPSLRDPRLHLASVIFTVHLLGQVALGFRVSVPQILVSILVCAVLEVVLTLRQTGVLVWPASAMLTGSGVALILRLVGMERGDHWSWRGWHLFALLAAVSLLSKYVLRLGGTHLFNPSNLGLVLGFLVLGSEVIEPLDFWWGPWGLPMAIAYAVILGGGLVITARLRLLPMAATFWVVLAGGLALLSASGHCMTAAWALRPVCGLDFWRVLVGSPEVLIFLFFMITDPKTIPSGRGARLLFAAGVAIVGTLLIAPQTTEFGAKVGLLAGLVVLTPFRRWFDRVASLDWLGVSSAGGQSPLRLLGRGVAMGAGVGLLGVAIVVGGIPARGVAAATMPMGEVEMLETAPLPTVTADPSIATLNPAVDPSHVARGLTHALAVVTEAMSRSDLALLRTVAGGGFLLGMEEMMLSASGRGEVVVLEYSLDRIHLGVTHKDGPQGGASLAVEAWGSIDEVVYRQGGEPARTTSPLQALIVLVPSAGDGWMIVAMSPQG